MLPLPSTRFAALLPRLAGIPFNTFFAEAVLRGRVQGRVYVDRLDDPEAFLIAHRCGLSLLAGAPDRAGLRAWLSDYALNTSGERGRMEFLQPWPFSWAEVVCQAAGDRFLSEDEAAAALSPAVPLEALMKGRVIGWRRLNFRFERERFEAAELPPLPRGFDVVRLESGIRETWEGSVPPREFWDTEADFASRGVAFGVKRGPETAALAFAAFVDNGILEIGIETQPAFRRLGLARQAGAALVRHCLAEGLEPVWACRGGNEGSRRSAEALGFVKTCEIPYLALATN